MENIMNKKIIKIIIMENNRKIIKIFQVILYMCYKIFRLNN